MRGSLCVATKKYAIVEGVKEKRDDEEVRTISDTLEAALFIQEKKCCGQTGARE